MSSTVGLMHPGAMGAAVGGQLAAAGHCVLWVPEGRSEESAHRAGAAALHAVRLSELVEHAEVVLSICPPAAAEDVARSVRGYAGVWVEANAIAPDRVGLVAGHLPGALMVDGAIIGSPPREGKLTTLYLSGPSEAVGRVAELFAGTLVEARVLGEALGRASALKMAYSHYQKASRVLAAVAYALAVRHGVDGELLEVAARRPGSYLAEVAYIPKTAARAWRWGPEMQEAASTLAAAGLPDGLAAAAADVLSLWPRVIGEGAGDVADALRFLTRDAPSGE